MRCVMETIVLLAQTLMRGSGRRDCGNYIHIIYIIMYMITTFRSNWHIMDMYYILFYMHCKVIR